MKLALTIQSLGHAAQTHIVALGERTSIGSGKGNAIRVPDASVSGTHCWVEWEGEQAQLVDAGSRNGLLVDGRRVARCVLSHGAVVKLGRTSVSVALERAAPAPAKSSGEGFVSSSGGVAIPPADSLQPLTPDERRYLQELGAYVQERIQRVRLADATSDEVAGVVKRQVAIALREREPPSGVDTARMEKIMLDGLLRYGPIQPYLEDDKVSEVMVNQENRVFVERAGRLVYTGDQFDSRQQLMNVIERIVSPLGRRIDESSPLVDARLPDGSRVNAIIPPLAIDGPCLTIRKFREGGFSIDQLVQGGAMSTDVARFLELCIRIRKNIIISGGTGSGKTTLLNTLAGFIPGGERIVTIEDSAELQLPKFHVVRLQARPENIEGRGEISIRDLVRNALRMRPDRIVVGECRGGEALDMIQAMNTGHDGSMTTVHANNPRDALRRTEVMCLMAGMDMPIQAIREQVVSAVDLVVQIQRFVRDGSRRVVSVAEVTGMQNGVVSLQEIFQFREQGVDDAGRTRGAHCACGVVPDWLHELEAVGEGFDLRTFDKPEGSA